MVLGLSPDPVDKLKKWQDKEEFGFDLLSDPDHKVLDAQPKVSPANSVERALAILAG